MTRKEHTTETMVAKEESSTEPVVFACHRVFTLPELCTYLAPHLAKRCMSRLTQI